MSVRREVNKVMSSQDIRGGKSSRVNIVVKSTLKTTTTTTTYHTAEVWNKSKDMEKDGKKQISLEA